jgi:hypothetical protein
LRFHALKIPFLKSALEFLAVFGKVVTFRCYFYRKSILKLPVLIVLGSLRRGRSHQILFCPAEGWLIDVKISLTSFSKILQNNSILKTSGSKLKTEVLRAKNAAMFSLGQMGNSYAHDFQNRCRRSNSFF